MKTMKPEALVVHHVVHLDADQRSRLLGGEPLMVQGVSLPTFFRRPDISTDPSEEIICHYDLAMKRGVEMKIEMLLDGYRVRIPRRSEPGQVRSDGMVESGYFRAQAAIVTKNGIVLIHHFEIKATETFEATCIRPH